MKKKGKVQNMNKIELLKQIKELSMNNIRCYSDSLLKNQPNERFKEQWKAEQERIKIIEEIIEDEKKLLIEEQNHIRHRKFNFKDVNFGEEIECVLIWDNNSFFLITTMINKIHVKQYGEVEDLFKDFITNMNELEFFRNMYNQQNDLEKI